MRNAFIEELILAAEKNERIVLVVGDLGYGVVEPFAKKFPKRFFNSGVAEQNMMGLSAGLASEGYHIFVYSIANFPIFRCAEQIRNDVDYHKLPVTIVAVGGGLAYGNLGYSHHAVQDYAFMRSLPHMTILSPGDPMEVRSCMRLILNSPQPSYLRLGKAGEPSFHQNVPNIENGEWSLVSPSKSSNKKKCLLTTGTTLGLAMEWQKDDKYKDYFVYSMPIWSMAQKKRQATQVSEWEEVVTLEDHLYDGGFGSWLLESLPRGQGLRERIHNIALDPAVCGVVGMQKALNTLGGLSLC